MQCYPYVVGDTNRDILSKLYLGEETFNRTCRRALRAVQVIGGDGSECDGVRDEG